MSHDLQFSPAPLGVEWRRSSGRPAMFHAIRTHRLPFGRSLCGRVMMERNQSLRAELDSDPRFFGVCRSCNRAAERLTAAESPH